MNCTGTGVPDGVVSLGSMVCVSVRLGISMICSRLSPDVPTKKVESSGLKAPVMGASAPLESWMFVNVPGTPKVVDGLYAGNRPLALAELYVTNDMVASGEATTLLISDGVMFVSAVVLIL